MEFGFPACGASQAHGLSNYRLRLDPSGPGSETREGCEADPGRDPGKTRPPRRRIDDVTGGANTRFSWPPG